MHAYSIIAFNSAVLVDIVKSPNGNPLSCSKINTRECEISDVESIIAVNYIIKSANRSGTLERSGAA